MSASLQPGPVRRLGVLAGAALATVAFVFLAIPNLLQWARVAGDGNPASTDYLAFAAGGQLAREAPARLYDLAAQRHVEQALAADAPCCPVFRPFVNPPHLAVAYGALGAHGFRAGYVATALVNLLLVGGLLIAVHELARPLSTALRGLLVTGTAASGPVAVALYQGGPSVVAALGVTLAVVGDRRRGALLTAAGLLAASTKPHLLVLPLLWLVLRGRWRALAHFAGLGAATIVVTLPLIGVGPWLRYPGALLHYSDPTSGLDVDPRYWWNLVGSLPVLGVDHRAGWLGRAGWLAFALGLVLMAGLVVLARRGRVAAGQASLAAALLALGVLVVPHANPHDALVIGPAFALSLLHTGSGGVARARGTSLLVLALLWPVVSTAAVLTDQHGAFAHLPVVFMALLVAVTACGVTARRSPIDQAGFVGPLDERRAA
jgi:hypothetical protein